MSVLEAGVQEEDDPGLPTVPPRYASHVPHTPSRLVSEVKVSKDTLRPGSMSGWSSDGSDSDEEMLNGHRRDRRASSVGMRNRDLPEDEQTLFSESDGEEDTSGAAKAEAAQAVW
jgi:hypothetical protein